MSERDAGLDRAVETGLRFLRDLDDRHATEADADATVDAILRAASA